MGEREGRREVGEREGREVGGREGQACHLIQNYTRCAIKWGHSREGGREREGVIV